MTEFKEYKRKKIAELRPVNGKELKYGLASNISISPTDKENGHPFLGDMIARNSKNYNDQWLVVKEYFEDNFEPLEEEKDEPENIQIKNLTFGQAIEMLKEGYKVAREGWNGKGMYLTLVQGFPVNGHLNADFVDSEVAGETQGKAGQMLSHIVMKTTGDSHFWGAGYSDYVPWLASQSDMLSEDWYIVDIYST